MSTTIQKLQKNLMELELGVSFKNRRPTAREIFKSSDIDLLPHSSADTLLGEIYDWNGRNWRTENDNVVGVIFTDEKKVSEITDRLRKMERLDASTFDFEFTKDHISELGFSIPSLFNIGFKGKINSAKSLSIKVNQMTKSRLTNIDPVGIEIKQALITFADNYPKQYREKLKPNFIAEALFYAESVEIEFEMESGVEMDISYDEKNVVVENKIKTGTRKYYKLKYKGNSFPFGATLKKCDEF